MTVLDTNLYLGRPGNLETLSVPRANIDRTRIRDVDVFALANGGARVAKQLGGARRYQINYNRLTYEVFKTLEAYDQGHNGPGPFVLLDPGIRNILTVNQSSTTSERNDTSNFTASGSGMTLSSSAALVRRGPRSLAATFGFTGTTGSITCDTPAPEWYAFPVQVGRSMVLSGWVRGGGTDGAVGVAPTLTWLDTTGAVLSTSTGSTVVSSSGSWQQATVIGTPPASAAFAVPRMTIVSGVNAGDILYLDQLMLHEGAVVDSFWSPGTGILPVSILGLPDSSPAYAPTYRDKPTLILQEVGNSG